MHNLAIVFTGPTLPPNLVAEQKLKSNIVFFESIGEFLAKGHQSTFPENVIGILPPVSEGDIFKLIPVKPKIIGIIDGFFENMPAVWHKEIMYAITNGIYVYGAASMGALRAAELNSFGMIGIGSIFEAFRNGVLEDDDEVTVVHGPRELGYVSLSEAMVNIRRTVDDAYSAGIIDEHHKTLFIQKLKKTFYKQRSYHLLRKLPSACPNTVQSFLQWLENNRKDQKKEDSMKLLKRIDQDFTKALPKRVLRYNFEDTAIWRRVLSA